MLNKQIPALLRPEPRQYNDTELVAELRYVALRCDMSRHSTNICEEAANRLEQYAAKG